MTRTTEDTSDPAAVERLPGELDDQYRILVVDDDAMLRRALVRTLERACFEVDDVADAGAARALLASFPYDAMLVDLYLRDADSLDLALLAHSEDAELPIILLGAREDVSPPTNLGKLGIFAFLNKPVHPHELIQLATRACTTGHLADVRRQITDAANQNGESAHQKRLDAAFSEAISQLSMVFQPVFDSRSGKPFGWEALVRPNHEGFPGPPSLFEAAEQLGRVHELGRAIRTVTTTAAHRAPEGANLLVNLHPSDLEDPDLYDPEAPLTALAERCFLEITERAQLDGITGLSERVRALRDLGFRIAVDDLGAGYSGLATFATLEPDLVKIDRSIVRRVDHSPRKQRLVQAVVQLCQDLHVSVIAEGVETSTERDALVDSGCHLLQGFLLGRPSADFA